MLLIPCPWCGPRNSSDMRYVDEVTTRPDPAVATQEEWRWYLYVRANPAGTIVETWFCRGCRRYFTAERDTMSNRFVGSRRPTRQQPESD